MINLFYTLLTFAGGILLGSAGVFISNKKTDTATQTVLWCLLMLPLFFGSVALGVWCENQVHPHSLVPIISQAMVALVWFYGLILGIAAWNKKELKAVLQDPKNSYWITAAVTTIYIKLPPILWLLMMFLSPLDAFTAGATASGLGVVVMTLLWIFFHLALYSKYGFKKQTI